MSNGEAAFLALVLVAFVTFIGVVGFLSIWTRIPRKSSAVGGTGAANAHDQVSGKWEKTAPASTAPGLTRTSQAA